MMFLLLYGALLPIIYIFTSGLLKDTLLYLHGVLLVFWCHCGSSTNDMYGLRHLWLNLQLPPTTFWCNMGYWLDNNKSFVTACENLVLAVSNKLNIQKNDKLLDVGFGCGDSCFFLANHFDCQVIGITNEASQCKLAKHRLQQLDDHLQENISLYQGSATELNTLIESMKVLSSSLVELNKNDQEEKFDHIISIDSAYHYDTRKEFFKQSFQQLKPGGNLGMWDIILHDDAITLNENQNPQLSSWKLKLWKFMCGLAHIPLPNLIHREDYVNQLKEIGFMDIQLEQIPPENNFGNLAKHCQNQIQVLKELQIGNWQTILYLQVSAFLFNYLGTHNHLQAIVVKASKPSNDQS